MRTYRVRCSTALSERGATKPNQPPGNIPTPSLWQLGKRKYPEYFQLQKQNCKADSVQLFSKIYGVSTLIPVICSSGFRLCTCTRTNLKSSTEGQRDDLLHSAPNLEQEFDQLQLTDSNVGLHVWRWHKYNKIK